MGRRSFGVHDLVEVYIHWQRGDAQRASARNLGLARNTVAKVIAAAEQAGLRQHETRSAAEWATFVGAHFPATGDAMARSVWFRELDRHRATIQEGLAHNHASTVWQRLCAATGLRVSLTTFYRYVKARGVAPVRASAVVIHRPVGTPGELAEVDFGRLGRWVDPATGRSQTLWAFVMVLCWSRHLYVCPVRRLNAREWLRCHVNAFAFFGAVPQRIVLDNLKDGVVQADLYDPQLNPSYAELAVYYDTLLDPCRAGRPTDKPHVERAIPYVRDSFWRGRAETMGILDDVAQEAERWCREVAGARIHRTTGQRPLELYLAEEQAAMRPLPPQPWELALWTTALVGRDTHCRVEGALYSVPWAYLGQQLTVRVSDTLVEFYAGTLLVRTHPRVAKGQRQTAPGDLPAARSAFFARNPTWCRQQAQAVGPAVTAVVQELLAVPTLTRLRQAQGVVRLAESDGVERLEAACARALAFGDPTYRTVKNIVAGGFELHAVPSNLPPRAGAFLRGPDTFCPATLSGAKEA